MLHIEYNNIDLTKSSDKKSGQSLFEITDEICLSIRNQEPFYKAFSIQECRKSAHANVEHAINIRKNFSDIIVIGMGGAVLNPEFVINLCHEFTSAINVHFLNNTDPYYLQNLLSKISIKNTAILAISNSGNTLETISLIGAMIAEYQKYGIERAGQYFYFITNKQNSTLYNIAQEIDATVIGHEQQISGRYSGLSNVTSFIAQIVGINIDEFYEGAHEIVFDYLNNKHNSKAAIAARSLYESELSLMVNIGYLQNFATYLEWYSQIISESLGKDGVGITPVRGLGPNDQHSMLQLYLEGRRDKLYTMFYVENIANNNKIATMRSFNYGYGMNIGAVNSINFQATKNALIKLGLPVRTVILKDLTAKSVGALMAHSMLEIITLGRLFRLNPFNQPGVELIKNESKRIIRQFSEANN